MILWTGCALGELLPAAAWRSAGWTVVLILMAAVLAWLEEGGGQDGGRPA